MPALHCSNLGRSRLLWRAAFACMLASVLLVTLTTSTVPEAIKSGAYQGPCNATGVTDFERWRGRPVSVLNDFLDGTRWEYVRSPTWWMECWSVRSDWLVLGVPVLIDAGDSLEAGSKGVYDGHFIELARTLVAGGQEDAGLRLGWEFNGNWFPWSATRNPQAFAMYFRRIVEVMGSVPGANFVFIWNPTVGSGNMSAEEAWPGNDVVDVIGLDLYDASWVPPTYYESHDSMSRLRAQQRAWHEYEAGDHGLRFWAAFAAAHRKPLAFPEWGLVSGAEGHGGGDNPEFVRRVRAWIDSHPLVFEIYFDHASGDLGEHSLRSGRFSESARWYQRLFGGSATGRADSP